MTNTELIQKGYSDEAAKQALIQQGYDKAIDEAIETVAKIEFIDRNPANVISDVIKQLATLKSEKK